MKLHNRCFRIALLEGCISPHTRYQGFGIDCRGRELILQLEKELSYLIHLEQSLTSRGIMNHCASREVLNMNENVLAVS
jgi:hypothetical protein